ncbi:hypothetical protein A4X06_0g4275 [Tilletia controversa]|uniref:F-box domain-containing protein n=2 Tax=Tilletia TaxID=13289 RepID=A0A8X7SX74_9BASI|nr:hypothetical protein CF335_g2967 [Tilletia laevis]KAE8247673.1 hypothetical protein A4X06_0g4275 [Tilletia controversa]KAE8263743.1 hypothetical protein A4X03_0g1461 [Tilletia caries]
MGSMLNINADALIHADGEAATCAMSCRDQSKRLALPPEIALRIGRHLQPETSTAYPLCLRRASPPNRLADLHAFASTCLSLRCLLAPVFWSSLVFSDPERLDELLDVLRYYQGSRSARSPRILSSAGPTPNSTARCGSIEFELPSFPSATEERPFFPDPLPFVRNFFLSFPRRIARFDVQAFLQLLRQLPQLEYLSWDAEITPPPSLWDIVGRVRGLHVDCKVFWQGNQGLLKLSNLESLALTTFDANLLPNHIPTLLLNLPSPLISLDMSTSKTSILHEDRLIQAGCFSRLEHLTLFAVTPEPPLGQALVSAGNTLRTLNHYADVNGGFRNYDDLWRTLTGQMKVLETLDVDPHPQQNTAPSFVDFVISTPTLHRINGRETSGLPPCLSFFDPEHPTGALAY